MKEDKTLVCKECGKEFVFSASEQEFYESKGFTNEPGRCLHAVSTQTASWHCKRASGTPDVSGGLR